MKKIKEFPPGTKVRLSTDYPGEEPREVAGRCKEVS